MGIDKALRKPFLLALCLNAGAISWLGASGIWKATHAATPPAAGRLSSRLIQLEALRPEKMSSKNAGARTGRGEKSASSGASNTGLGPNDGSLFSDHSAPTRSHSARRLTAREQRARHTAQDREKRRLQAQAVRHPAQKLVQARRAKKGALPNISVAMHPRGDKPLGVVHLHRPSRPVVGGGLHGILDLRHVKITAHYVIDDPKNKPTQLRPDKLIGKSTTYNKPDPGNKSLCLPTGGNTIVASNLTILWGKDNKIDGTKYCVPGSGIPNTGQPSDQSRPSMSAATGGGSVTLGEHIYQGGSVQSSTTGMKGAVTAQRAASDSPPADAGIHGPQDFGRAKPTANGQGKAQATRVADQTDQASQQRLQNSYDRLARGPVTTLAGERPPQNPGLEPGAPIRALHLPEAQFNPDHTIPGVLVPKDMRRLVVSPKPHRGAPAPKQTKATRIAFDLTPQSIGSHSAQGNLPWAPEPVKKPKGRTIKGKGKRDGGGDGSGLLGEYFLGADFQQPLFKRPDRCIDFTWTGTQVDPRLPQNNAFSVRWTGKIKPRYSDTYSFYTASDDGVRLYVDGKLLIANWSIHPATEDVAQATLQAGREYPIVVEYYEKNGMSNEVMKLYWESAHQVKEYVPQSCLVYPKVEEDTGNLLVEK